MKLRTVAPLFSALLLACSATPETSLQSSGDEIVGGSSAADVFPNVGYFSEGEGSAQFCTGTLVAPRVVLSAAHCFQGATNDVHFTFGAVGSGDGYRVVRIVNHPSYDESFERGTDIAYAVLERAPANVEPASIRAAASGCGYTAVGYGRTAVGPQDLEGNMPGNRRQLDQCARAPRNGWVYVSSEVGSTCFGDSGGPLFVRGQNTIVGVLSHGTAAREDRQCAAGDDSGYTVLQSGLVDDFVQQALAAGDGEAELDPDDDDDNGCADQDGDGWCDEQQQDCADQDGDGWCDEQQQDCADQDGDGWCDW